MLLLFLTSVLFFFLTLKDSNSCSANVYNQLSYSPEANTKEVYLNLILSHISIKYKFTFNTTHSCFKFLTSYHCPSKLGFSPYLHV